MELKQQKVKIFATCADDDVKEIFENKFIVFYAVESEKERGSQLKLLRFAEYFKVKV